MDCCTCSCLYSFMCFFKHFWKKSSRNFSRGSFRNFSKRFLFLQNMQFFEILLNKDLGINQDFLGNSSKVFLKKFRFFPETFSETLLSTNSSLHLLRHLFRSFPKKLSWDSSRNSSIFSAVSVEITSKSISYHLMDFSKKLFFEYLQRVFQFFQVFF